MVKVIRVLDPLGSKGPPGNAGQKSGEGVEFRPQDPACARFWKMKLALKILVFSMFDILSEGGQMLGSNEKNLHMTPFYTGDLIFTMQSYERKSYHVVVIST